VIHYLSNLQNLNKELMKTLQKKSFLCQNPRHFMFAACSNQCAKVQQFRQKNNRLHSDAQTGKRKKQERQDGQG